MTRSLKGIIAGIGRSCMDDAGASCVWVSHTTLTYSTQLYRLGKLIYVARSAPVARTDEPELLVRDLR